MSSRFRGVAQHKVTRRWESHIWHDKKQHYVGSWSSEAAAAEGELQLRFLWDLKTVYDSVKLHSIIQEVIGRASTRVQQALSLGRAGLRRRCVALGMESPTNDDIASMCTHTDTHVYICVHRLVCMQFCFV